MPSAGNLKGSASTMTEMKNKSKPGDNSYDPAQGFYNSNDKTKAASTNAVPASAVPKTDKATGQMITPAESLAMQEQKALKIAPYKADLETLAAQLSTISTEFDEADDDEKIGAAKMKLEKIKASMSATNE